MPLPGWSHCYNLLYLYFSCVWTANCGACERNLFCVFNELGIRGERAPTMDCKLLFSDWWAGLMLWQFFLLNGGSGWGTINLRLRTPWHHSAHKADTPLAVLLAMLEEPKRAAGPRGMVGADFTTFDFIFFSFSLTFSRWNFCSKLIAYGSMSWGNRTCLLGNHFLSTVSG